MGNKKSKQQSQKQPSPEAEIKPKTYTPFELSQIFEVSFYIQTPPILKGNEVILLYTNNKTKQTKYSVINLNDKKLTIDKEDIKCDPEFDVFNTVYALNEKNNTVYFIQNNKNILKWDLNDNQIVSLNKSIITTNDNYATITYINDELHILGAEQSSDKNDNYFIIPYSTAVSYRGSGPLVSVLRKKGKFSRVINVKYGGLNYILIMGGQRTECLDPSNLIWRYVILSHSQNIVSKCVNSFANYCIPIPMSIISIIYEFYCIRDYNEIQYFDEGTSVMAKKWSRFQLPLYMNSHGAIHYENRYLFLFGGNVMKRNWSNKESNGIFALPLQDNEYNLEKWMWYKLQRKLPEKNCFHAIYNGGKIVHLFSYSGIYYTMNIDDILDSLQKEEHFRVHTWTETGGFIPPKKTFAVQHMGVKSETDS